MDNLDSELLSKYHNNKKEIKFWESQGRKEISIERPIVYGTEATLLSKSKTESEGQNTHSWKAYVRGAYNEDISYLIQKVVFFLDPSFESPERIVTKPPFQIEEEGWGEFEIKIGIYFQDPSENPILLRHMLRLFHPDGSLPVKGRPVISELIDYIIFSNPTIKFYQILQDNPLPDDRNLMIRYYDIDNSEIEKMKEVSMKIKSEIGRLKEEYDFICDEIVNYFVKLNKLNTE